MERDDNIAEWIKINERLQSRQSDGNESKRDDGRGHRHEGGIAAASRELGVEESDARRSVKVSSLSEEAKDAARETGLDNNRSALLEAARETEPKAQVAKLSEYRSSKVDGDVKLRAAREVAAAASEVFACAFCRISFR